MKARLYYPSRERFSEAEIDSGCASCGDRFATGDWMPRRTTYGIVHVWCYRRLALGTR